MFRRRNKSKKLKKHVPNRKRTLLKKAKQRNNWDQKESSEKDLQRIGARNDLFNDSSTASSYSWVHLPPLLLYNLNIDSTRTKGIQSLKQICSRKIAENADSLEATYLDLAPWSVWKPVWDQILVLHNDSFRTFGLFASKFSERMGFRCHWQLQISNACNPLLEWHSLLKVRSDCISSVQIPNSKNHRIENIFSNISVLDFVKHIHRLSFRPWVLLDASAVAPKYSRDEHLKIFSVANLVALDLSNSQVVDDLFLYNMSISISKDGKLSKLTILKINNCPNVTIKGLIYLLQLSKDPNFNCSLSLIESDIHLTPTDFTIRYQNVKNEQADFIQGTKWTMLPDDPENGSISKLPLGLKLHCLYRNYSGKIILNESGHDMFPQNTTNSKSYLFQVKDKIVLDIMIHDMIFSLAESNFRDLQDAWSRRSQLRNLRQRNKSYCYIIDVNANDCPVQLLSPNLSHQNRREESVMFRASERKSGKKTNINKRERPAAKKFNANQFFEI